VFGTHTIPVHIEQNGIHIDITEKNGPILYARSCGDETVEKVLLTGSSTILINPVEPLNKPRELTPYFMIELQQQVVIEPKATKVLYLTFPVETGIFIQQREESEVIDILTTAKQKYALYGDPAGGVLCKFWKSAVHGAIPTSNPVQEGIMELTITNAAGEWVEISRAVFNAYGMKLYYSDSMVSMKGHMKITAPMLAETDFVDAPLKKGMQKSLELYTARKLLVLSSKYSMTEGL